MWLLLAQIPTIAATPESATSFGWLVLKMVVVLVVVLVAAILILKYLVPKLGKMRGGFGGQYIDVVARRTLEHKKQLWIVRVGKRHFFLGSADGAVTCLSELAEEDVKGEVRNA